MPLQALRRLLRGSDEGHALINRLRMAADSVEQLKEAARWQEPDDERSYWIASLAAEIGPGRKPWTGICRGWRR